MNYVLCINKKHHVRYISKYTVIKKYKDIYLIEAKNINFEKEVLLINKKWKASFIAWLLNHSYCPLHNIKEKFFIKPYIKNKGKK